ncbi:acyl carrier protein phosphodiesterase [Pseudofulvibacter geojedonensis]|uniref:ACP phosphodiesterase n=1 Tax=Pseudofulvibacter geojedonensis TaxID=1123758 RepID=A0ABW3I2J2_9FLAO
MNFLAHIYLSNEENAIKIGNFIADGIRGKQYLNYPKDIQKGILLHRQIDTFTDKHEIVKQSKRRLYKAYGHYASVIVDILYDHFLAKNWMNYSDIPLHIYVNDFYNLLEDNFELLPISVKKMMPYMMQDNWLLSYASIDGITKVLEGMNRRTNNHSRMNLAVTELKEFYNEFENEFTLFFEDLIIFTKKYLSDN